MLGLFLGIGLNILSQLFTISYYYFFRKTPVIQDIRPSYQFKKECIGYIMRSESFTVIIPYLILTWSCNLLPLSYYDILAPINWLHILAQLIIVDFLMFMIHIIEHRFLYKIHKPHHHQTNPILFNAFQGHILDTCALIIIPLFITSQIVPANTWSYIIFGIIFSNHLLLIHSEYSHPFDPILHSIGIMTARDHNIHHSHFKYNFGHFFRIWDLLNGTYKGEIINWKDQFTLIYMICFKVYCRLQNSTFLYRILHQVSRSFSLVIQQLPQPLRNQICIFYLILRALDTIEDDTALPIPMRKQLLANFYKILMTHNYKISDYNKGSIGYGNEQKLLLNLQHILNTYHNLSRTSRNIICDITRCMSMGMIKFLDKEIITVEEYNEYCYIAAGLVGEGLSRLFKLPIKYSKEMGIFLQKTNIIRDYAEDLQEGRTYWPKEIWEKYANQLNQVRDVKCLNEMIENALQLVPSCLKYLEQIKDKKIFKFCAIPQVMAVKTLDKLYNNDKVFTQKVKISKVMCARIFYECDNIKSVRKWFNKKKI